MVVVVELWAMSGSGLFGMVLLIRRASVAENITFVVANAMILVPIFAQEQRLFIALLNAIPNFLLMARADLFIDASLPVFISLWT